MATKRKHFVLFISPGTFYAETTQKPIEAWDISKACQMAGEVTERYGAKPYAFQFLTCIVGDEVPDGEGGSLKVHLKEVERSGSYFLGGKVLSYDEVVARNDPQESILRSNMRGNGDWFVVENTNSYRATLPFGHKDIVVNPETGDEMERGDSGDRQKYRKRMDAKRDRERAAYLTANG